MSILSAWLSSSPFSNFSGMDALQSLVIMSNWRYVDGLLIAWKSSLGDLSIEITTILMKPCCCRMKDSNWSSCGYVLLIHNVTISCISENNYRGEIDCMYVLPWVFGIVQWALPCIEFHLQAEDNTSKLDICLVSRTLTCLPDRVRQAFHTKFLRQADFLAINFLQITSWRSIKVCP